MGIAGTVSLARVAADTITDPSPPEPPSAQVPLAGPVLSGYSPDLGTGSACRSSANGLSDFGCVCCSCCGLLRVHVVDELVPSIPRKRLILWGLLGLQLVELVFHRVVVDVDALLQLVVGVGPKDDLSGDLCIQAL